MKPLSVIFCALAMFISFSNELYSDDGNSRRKDSRSKDTILLARLNGFQEVPSVSTVATGEFRARISHDETYIDYELTYEGLQNTVTQAHIHFAQRHVNGSIVVWLCGTTTNPGPAGTQTCPQNAKANPVTGRITAPNVIAASNPVQLINAGDLAKVIEALRAGAAYANVHSTPTTTGGEIRGQIRVVHDHR